MLALAALAHSADVDLSPEALHRSYGLGGGEPSAPMLVRIAQEQGFRAKFLRPGMGGLKKLRGQLPVLAQQQDGSWVVLVGLLGSETGSVSRIALVDPGLRPARVLEVTQEEFAKDWSGALVAARHLPSLADKREPFGFLWFVREMLHQRSAFRDVAAASVILSFLGLGAPLFTQLVIDKVLVHENLSTLLVLTVGIVAVLLFETVFTFLRQFLMLGATNKIDMRLTRLAFTHLMSLPIPYFETRSAGVILRNVYQLEKVRAFFTGPLFGTMLEVVGLLVFGPLLFLYSPTLAFLVLGFTFLMALVIVILIKPYQIRLNALFDAEGRRNSLLVESIHGMRTVKALAVEPSKVREWTQRSAKSILTHFEVMKISISAQAVTHVLERLSSIAVIVIGATMIFDQTLSLGALIAFQMLSGRVTGPLVAIVGLVHQYQETNLAMKLLAEVMDHPTEGKSGGGGLRPLIRGGIRFEGVRFIYPGAPSAALERVSLEISPGQVIGIVGRSGSGKTTLTRLIQSLYPVTEGVLRIDGVDIREIDLGYLRSNTGVVLQDNFLFRGTVRDNIAASRLNAPMRDVVAAAQAAGADEFIERLPQGYETLLEENAANLSGGQKQRLAIARAILPEPRLLILDEAASALDPESEAIFIHRLRIWLSCPMQMPLSSDHWVVSHARCSLY
ncbi:MAG: peptidase domain-containing ABC transporter [Betaproteobacteria bacterium]|nr:peptidase domain-containing ABC transporter [Betaproteobacteria bacterium]